MTGMSELLNDGFLDADDGFADRFVIDTPSKADWAIRKIAEKQAEVESWKNYYKDAMAKIQKDAESYIQYLTGLLELYFDQVPHHVTKTQESHSLPSGTLVMKKASLDYERSEEKLLSFLHASGMEEYVKIEESVKWGDLKKLVKNDGEHVTIDGEIVDCIKLIEKAPAFSISKPKGVK